MGGDSVNTSHEAKKISPKTLRLRKGRSTNALQDIVESQKLRRILQVELRSRQEVSNDSEVVTQTASQKLTVSCGSQTCTIQTEVRKEQRVCTEIPNSPKSVVTVGSDSKKQVFVSAVVPPLSPGRSRSASGNRSRIGNNVSLPRTPPRSPQTPKSPRSASTSPSSARKQSAKPSPQTKSSPCSPLRQLESATNREKKRKPRNFGKPNRVDDVQVKPLVNTYHVITEKPMIRARKGIPKQLASSNVKEVFVWATTDHDQQARRSSREETPKQDERSHELSKRLETSKITATPPPKPTRGFSRHQPIQKPLERDAVDELSDDDYKTIKPTRKFTAKPLVNTSFQPSPPKRSKKGVAMFVPMSESCSSPEKARLLAARPPSTRKHNRSEVLAFMKRKRLERRQQNKENHSQKASRKVSPVRSFQLEAESRCREETSDAVGDNVLRHNDAERPVPAKMIPDSAQQLAELIAHLHDPRAEHLETLLTNFEKAVSAEVLENGFSESLFDFKVNEYASVRTSIEKRLEHTTRRFESFLTSLGLREDRSIQSFPNTPESVVANSVVDVLTPSKPVRVSALLSSLQDTPRPKFGAASGDFLSVTETGGSSPQSRKPNAASLPQTTDEPAPSSFRSSDEPNVSSPSKHRSTEQPTLSPSKIFSSRDRSVQTRSGGRRAAASDPNFAFQWRDKYLKGSLADSSTPKKSGIDLEDIVCDLDVSRISAEKAPNGSNDSGSDIDNSALKQAREVLRQLDNSQKNLEKTEKVLAEIKSLRSIDEKAEHRLNDSNNNNNNNMSNRESGNRQKSKNSTQRSIVIEGDDILEEAKRVLREINSSDVSNKSGRSSVSRNLVTSFDKIFENEVAQRRTPSPTIDVNSSTKKSKKSYAPNSLSNLATNELDFLEDCNDTLLKISEISRAKNYAFARETNIANEFLRREYHKTSTPIRSGVVAPLANEDIVDELRKSLQEAFDQIENNSKEMSRLRKDVSASQVERLDEHANVIEVSREAHVEKPVAREDHQEENIRLEKSRSREGSTTKTASDSKSGSVSFETTSLTDDKRTDSKLEGSSENVQNSDSVSEETPLRSSVEKSPKSSPTVSTVKTEVQKSTPTTSPLRTEALKSPSSVSTLKTEKPKSPTTDSSTKTEDSTIVASISTDGNADGKSLSKALAKSELVDTLSTEKNEERRHQKMQQLNTETQAAVASTVLQGKPATIPDSSDGALITALINYIDRRERHWFDQRSENLKILKQLGVAETSASKGVDSKMAEAKDQRKERNELQKLLKILAKRKGHSKSSSSSEQQTNTSSDESSDVLTDEKSAPENDPAKSSSSASHSIVLGTSDFIENMDLVKLLIKRNNELSHKEKFVKYLERERQKIERRSDAIKKREAKLMAEMKAAAEREVDTKMQFFKDTVSTSTEGSEKSESHTPSLRPLSARRFRSRKDSSGSEDIASLSETDVSDIEGSKRALKDEEERETRQLEKLKRALETPDSNRRPGRKEMLMRRIEVLEKLLANNKAAVAMLESATHVMPKIRKPKVAVQERSQESEESDASREGLTEFKGQHSKTSVSESEASDSVGASHSGEQKTEPAQENVSPKSSIVDSVAERHKTNEAVSTSSSSSSSSSSSEPIAAEVALEALASPTSESPQPEAPLDSDSSSRSEITKSEKNSDSKSSTDSENTKNRKVDSTLSKLVDNLKEDTLNEVVKATKLDGHATNLMERLVDEAVGAINRVKSGTPASRGLGWDEFSPISTLNGTLAEIGQQIFVDDASQQVCIRTIPNKPPPPYTPPKVVQVAPTSAVEPIQPKAVSIAPIKGVKEQRQPEPVVPMTLGELQTEASHAAEYLFGQLIAGRRLEEASYEDTHCQGVADMAKVQYGEMLFDVAKETAEKLFRVGRNSGNMFSRPLPSKERHQAFIDAIVGDILKSEKSKSTRPKCIWSYINNRRMDYIDFIMGKEIREEEKEWTEYTSCLEQVNEQLVEQVFAHIVDINVATILEVL